MTRSPLILLLAVVAVCITCVQIAEAHYKVRSYEAYVTHRPSGDCKLPIATTQKGKTHE